MKASGRQVFIAVFLAAAMSGAAIVVASGLHGGFDRAADRADLPDVIARFAPQSQGKIDPLLRALPNLASHAYRYEIDRVQLAGNAHSSANATLEVVQRGRRGYAVVAGHDLHGAAPAVLVERGLARAWHLHVGGDVVVGRLGDLRIAGVFLSPDDVAYPLASAPHVLVSEGFIRQRFHFGGALPVNTALLWAVDGSRTPITLEQARATTFSVRDLRFVTRAGVRVLIDQAAGIVLALFAAFSLVALAAAATLVAARAAADVQRRLATLGIERALGFTRGALVRRDAVRSARVGLVAGLLGIAAGALAAYGPSSDLLSALNEEPPGLGALLPLLAAGLALVVVLSAGSAALPAWRALGGRPVTLLRGAELTSGRRRRVLPGRGFITLGARLGAARRTRALLGAGVLGVAGAVVLLLLGLASLLVSLRDDPGELGKRYQLTAQLPAGRLSAVEGIPGVAAAGLRYVVSAADSFALGETVKVIGLSGDHTRFEDPPLASGRRLRGDGEAEIGLGLAQALGLGVGGTLAVQLQGGGEARFRISGIVRALDADGRVAYVQPPRLLAANPSLVPEIVIRLRREADRGAVSRRLTALGATPARVGGATTRNGSFLGTLATLLRVVAGLDALVCLVALLQALALTAQERRPVLALLRAQGAGAATVIRVLAGAALGLVIPAFILAVVLERYALAPLVTSLAADYADLDATASAAQSALFAAGLLVLAAAAATLVARRVLAEPPIQGLRGE